ncbi:uncharacterized protein LOC136064544 [Quercus suber]|uniref:uncharacterized protein LOC136064543 n=1 Tax=Quercus suber TaxID=58331 RepID=UPI0032DEA6A8
MVVTTEASRAEFLEVDDCLSTVEHKVTQDMQQILSSDFTAEEIKIAMFQMRPTKVLGPDGMNALFYQKFWHIVGDNVVSAVLKQILPAVISPTQSAFVPGRLITDNVLVAYEVLHSMHSWKKGKTSSLALKLDISKAYDCVEWNFLKGIMIKLGFLDKWIQLVMGCVTTPSFSILVNGKEYGNIRPTKGI